MYESVVKEITNFLDERQDGIVQHLSEGQNRIKIQVKIQSATKISFGLETSTKQKLSGSNIADQKQANSFNPRKYESEIAQAIRHYVTSCRFYSLPLELNIFVNSNNKITGNLISNFIFKDN